MAMQDAEPGRDAGDKLHNELHDEFCVEDLDGPRTDRQRLLSLTRRLWESWQRHHGGGRVVPMRVVAAGLTVALGLTLLGMAGDGQPQLGGAVSRGADPVP